MAEIISGGAVVEPSTDEDIIRRIVAGEVNLFEVLLTRYRQHVSRIVAGHVPR